MMSKNINFSTVAEFTQFWENYAKSIVKNGLDKDFLFAHKSDHDAIKEISNKKTNDFVKIKDYNSYLKNKIFIESHFSKKSNSSSAIHLGLPLSPYAGNLKTAKLVLLLMNPGVSAASYFLMESNSYDIKKSLSHILRPSYMMPERAWTGGYSYGIKRWKKVLDAIYAKTKDMTVSLELLRRGVAILQYSPYPSKTGDWKLLNKLPTSKYSKDVAQLLVKDGKVVVCGRGHEHWGIEKNAFKEYALNNPRNPQFEKPECVAELLMS